MKRSVRSLFLGAAVLAPGCAAQREEPLNFVVIHLDDMGYGDLTVTGATGYRTPNIDRLCAEGMRLTEFYASQAVSSASRAGLLTGCYPNRLGFAGALNPNSPVGLNPDEETIATLLREEGYATSAIGKWHLGDRVPFMPLNHGFDEYYGLLYSNDMWPWHPTAKYPPLPLYEGNEVVNHDVRPEDQEMLTTQYTERAVKFIAEHRDGPFFLYLAHTMPHVPLYVSDKFRGKSQQGLYGDVMMELDWSVGEVLAALAENGIEDNTVVIFTSDNGPWINYGNHAGSTGGLREGKGTSFEGGQRVPFIIRWPGRVPAGVVSNQLAANIDILPTIASLAGARLPAKQIDGVDVSAIFFGDTDAEPREHLLYYYRDNHLEGVRNDRFKLVLPHVGRSYEGHLPGNDGQPGYAPENVEVPMALYDLRRDPGERYDVQEQHPEVIEELMEVVEAARDDMGDKLTGRQGANRRPMVRIEQ
ncbi:sulfatase [Alistipes sp. OttesenSCG-928-B03]|nr:sulfatase [Alistipes sp. OttesenSCG-928-B03]